MKKNFLLLMIIASAIVVTSCNKHMAISKAGETPVLMLRSDLKEILGPAYNSDSMIFRLHVTNTAEVSWKSEISKTKVKADVNENGQAESFRDQNKEVVAMILPAGTEGQPDSVLRNGNEITAIKVKYVIRQTGKVIHVWYFASADENDLFTVFFQSKDDVKQRVNGILLTRVTLDNRLKWIFNRDDKSNTTKTMWDVTSPFGTSKAIDSMATKTSPVKIKPPKKEEEEN